MMSKAIGLTINRLGVVLRAAQKATGIAKTTAQIVPKVAILMVSQSGCQSSLAYAHFGLAMRSPKSTACLGASKTNSQMVFWFMIRQQKIMALRLTNQANQIVSWVFVVRRCQLVSLFNVTTGITAPAFEQSLNRTQAQLQSQ